MNSPNSESWYFASGKQKLGPFSFAQLQQLAASGRIAPETMVLQPGDAKWARAESVPGLFAAATPTETVNVRCENPECGKTLRIKQDSFGKRIRCPSCKHIFIIPVLAPAPPPEPVVVEVTVKTPEKNVEEEDEPEPPRRKKREDEDEPEPRPRQRRKAEKEEKPASRDAMWIIGGVSAVLLFICCGGCGGIVYLATSAAAEAKKGVADADELWKADKRDEAIAKLTPVLLKSSAYLDEGTKSMQFQRAIEHEVEKNRMDSARQLIEEAQNRGVVLNCETKAASEFQATTETNHTLKELTTAPWSGSESLQGYGDLKFTFRAKGSASMTDRDGTVNGTYTVQRRNVTLHFPGQVTYSGDVIGRTLSGSGSNPITRWDFKVSR
jgi:DNA-directed RNA polymerase subunit RPC12/RpoP